MEFLIKGANYDESLILNAKTKHKVYVTYNDTSLAELKDGSPLIISVSEVRVAASRRSFQKGRQRAGCSQAQPFLVLVNLTPTFGAVQCRTRVLSEQP